ncbi:MAG: hypothetical protein K2X87_05295 [Gemmataceae bacterium]|nr:hypothetical protein [Gemmataceae bacterium]
MSGRAKGGRPPTEFTDDQLDRATELLGRRVFLSRVCDSLCREFGLSRDVGYRLIGAAQRRAFDALRGKDPAADPLTAQYLFLMSVIADDDAKTRDKVAASLAVIKLLGLNKILDALGAEDADDVLAGILARRKDRSAAGGIYPAAN